MSSSNNDLSFNTVATAERILFERLGAAVRLGDGDDLGGSRRSRVYRFAVRDGPRDAPASIIVKQANPTAGTAFNPDVPEIPAWTLFNDWAGVQFLSHVADGVSIGPMFYGGDRDSGLFVLEDLGSDVRLDHLLLGSDPVAAEQGLLDYAATLGRMHALTCGRRAAFDRLREALGPATLASGYYAFDWIATVFHAMLEALDIAPAHGVEDDLARVTASMREPGAFLAYTHGDPCPDNVLRAGSAMRLVDFEGGMFGHALRDGVYGRMHFPTCWCVNRIPAPIPLRMEAAYRAELVKGCPAAADDEQFYRGVVEAGAYRVLEFLTDFPMQGLLEQDRPIKVSTARQRVLLRFDILAQTTAEIGHLEALGATIGAAASQLRRLWPPEADAMPLYPAFR